MSAIIGASKLVLGGIASLSVGTVVGTMVKATAPIGVPALKKAGIVVGSVVLSNMAAGLAASYVEGTIDQAVDGWEKAKRDVKNAKESVKKAQEEAKKASEASTEGETVENDEK